MSKLAICLQYYHGDYDAAMTLARLIAGNEPTMRDDVIFCFVPRFDAQDPDPSVYDEVSHKFRTTTHRTTTTARGWPDGCNAIAIDTLRFADQESKYGTWYDIIGILLLESDCIPIAQDWIDKLITEWTRKRHVGHWLMGTWRDGGGELGHINGNMIVVPNFASLVDLSRIPPMLAWDCAITPQVHKHWHVTDLICNRWQEMGLSDETITKHRDEGRESPVLVHGVKDSSVLDYAKRVLRK
jgi:hypothetical protein